MYALVKMRVATEANTETLNKNEGSFIKTSRCPLVYLSVYLSIIKADGSLASGGQKYVLREDGPFAVRIFNHESV